MSARICLYTEKNGELGKFLSILGKIIALTSVVLFMLKMIPANGIIQWSMLLVAIILIFIGNKFE